MNTTILEAAGLDPSSTETWDKLREYCKTIKEKAGKYGMILISDIWFLEAFLLENASSSLNAGVTKTNLDSKGSKNSF